MDLGLRDLSCNLQPGNRSEYVRVDGHATQSAEGPPTRSSSLAACV